MSKEENVIKYYLLCNKLKNTIRSGWKAWNVKRERLESVAEHIYGVQMLALAMKSEYQYDIDILKVINMLAVHELGEIIIGDIIAPSVSGIDKKEIERQAVHSILEPLMDCDYIESLFLEFESHKTKEALFAFECDKLECDLQSKLYDQEGCIDLNNQENNKFMKHPIVKYLLDEGNSFSDMWLKFGLTVYSYDDNFRSVSEFAINNGIKEGYSKQLQKKKTIN